MQRFRGGLVFQAHRRCVSLNSRLGSNKEDEEQSNKSGPDSGPDHFQVKVIQVAPFSLSGGPYGRRSCRDIGVVLRTNFSFSMKKESLVITSLNDLGFEFIKSLEVFGSELNLKFSDAEGTHVEGTLNPRFSDVAGTHRGGPTDEGNELSATLRVRTDTYHGWCRALTSGRENSRLKAMRSQRKQK